MGPEGRRGRQPAGVPWLDADGSDGAGGVSEAVAAPPLLVDGATAELLPDGLPPEEPPDVVGGCPVGVSVGFWVGVGSVGVPVGLWVGVGSVGLLVGLCVGGVGRPVGEVGPPVGPVVPEVGSPVGVVGAPVVPGRSARWWGGGPGAGVPGRVVPEPVGGRPAPVPGSWAGSWLSPPAAGDWSVVTLSSCGLEVSEDMPRVRAVPSAAATSTAAPAAMRLRRPVRRMPRPRPPAPPLFALAAAAAVFAVFAACAAGRAAVVSPDEGAGRAARRRAGR